MSQINFDILKITEYIKKSRRSLLNKTFINKIIIYVIIFINIYIVLLIALNNIRVN